MTIQTPLLNWHEADDGAPQAKHPVYGDLYRIEPLSVGWQVTLSGEPVSEVLGGVQGAAMFADWLAYGAVVEAMLTPDSPHHQTATWIVERLLKA